MASTRKARHTLAFFIVAKNPLGNAYGRVEKSFNCVCLIARPPALPVAMAREPFMQKEPGHLHTFFSQRVDEECTGGHCQADPSGRALLCCTVLCDDAQMYVRALRVCFFLQEKYAVSTKMKPPF